MEYEGEGYLHQLLRHDIGLSRQITYNYVNHDIETVNFNRKKDQTLIFNMVPLQSHRVTKNKRIKKPTLSSS